MSSKGFMDVSQATDLATFKRNLASASATLGFPLVGCVLSQLRSSPIDAQAVYFIGNTPEAFAASAADVALTIRDPVMTWLRAKKLQPVVYDQTFYTKAGASDLWEEQAAFGFRCGIAVSFDLPGNWRFSFGIDRDEPVPDGEKLATLQSNLLLFGLHAQAAICRLVQRDSVEPRRPAIEQAPRVSARELECLKWTRDSKTAWEVGLILGISERTVNAHISNAMRKLGCFNKHQAVLKAIDIGLFT
jgi:DNA-binding CsgD family transcriptional regulator